MSDFSPGPWSFSPQDGGPHNCLIAQVWDRDGAVVADIEPRGVATEADANARLVAAAPALLEALRVLKSAFDAFTSDANWGASILQADTIRQVNEAPFVVNRALKTALGVAAPDTSERSAMPREDQ